MVHSQWLENAISTQDAIWPTILGWFIIVIGWLANHFLSEVRDRRKEVRNQIDELIQSLDKFREDAIKFHSAEIFDEQSASNLKFSLRKIEGAALRMSMLEERDIGILVKRIRQAATLKNFEPSDFQPQKYSSGIMSSVQLEVEEFIASIEGCYSRKYPNRFPYYRF